MTTPAPMIQGVAAADTVTDPQTFYAATQRQRYSMATNQAASGPGSTDSVQLRQAGIVAGLEVRISGTVTFGGTIGTTTASYRWPYDIVRFKISANGQSQLVDAGGLRLRALELAQNPKVNDRGVSRSFGGSTRTQGTGSLASEDWGTNSSNVVAPGTNTAAAAAYTVDLTFWIPLAADPTSLLGAVFAQSSATNLTLSLEWATQGQILAALGGSATFASALRYDVTGVVYSIPSVGGKRITPDLSLFHQLSETQTTALGQGENEFILPGTGQGRTLLRVISSISTGTSPGTPLAVTDANYGPIGWRYGGNTTPEIVTTGSKLRAQNERETGCDIGSLWGLMLHDWAGEFALRDAINTGETTDLRMVYTLVNSPTTPVLRLLQETVFSGNVGA